MIEIEKKYRLDVQGAEALRRRLSEARAVELRGPELEVNTLYAGPGLVPSETHRRALRLRRTPGRALLTFKERPPTDAPVKRQREEETAVSDPAALAAILEALGYRPALVYEKRRTAWQLAGAEVVLDELPFGLFAEIEGSEESIARAEQLLGLEGAGVEDATYPELAARHGRLRDGVVEARFE